MIGKILKFIWQLPQHIVAGFYYCWCADGILMKEHLTDCVVYTKDSPGCVTLGQFIFVSPNATEITLQHEQGHMRQSLYLGPLYLLVIGLPSLLWASFHKRIAPKKSYYWFYTERWADKIMGIDRKEG